MRAYRYSATAHRKGGIPDAESIIDQLARHVLEETSLERAMQEMCKHGVEQKYDDSLDGLNELATQLKQQRKRLLSEHSLDPLLRQFSEQLQSLVHQELQTLEEQFRRREEAFNQKLESHLKRAGDVLRKLEEMRTGKRRKTSQACARLEKEHEQLFLENHELEMETRATHNEESRRLAQLQQFPNSPSRTLQRLKGYKPVNQSVSQALASLEAMAEQMAAIERASLQPGFTGSRSLDLDEALDLISRIRKMERLEYKLRRGSLTAADEEFVGELLGFEALDCLRHITALREALAEAGYLVECEDGARLTPRAIRKIGQKALSDIFSGLGKSRLGGHEITTKGGAGEPDITSTKEYRFGDSFNVHLSKTLMNALLRDARQAPIDLSPADFEIYQEHRTAECSNVLMLDLSYTMAQNKKLQAAKKVILALDSLIRTKFPKDTLHIIGFATYARELTTEELPYVNLSLGNPFTNIQDGLRLAEQLMSRDHGKNRQIILITDGEPTAFCRNGDLIVDYPPTPEIFAETMKEVARLTRKGIVVNTFMLDDRPLLVEFVEQMTRMNKGRAFFSTPNALGEYLLIDYINRRRRMVN